MLSVASVKCLMIFIYVANVVAITRRYYKLFTKNLDIIRFAFYSGGQLEEFFKYRQALQFYARNH